MSAVKKYIALYFELAVWLLGLLCLALMNPAADTHFTLCFFKWTGLSFCPGCGLGHSISLLFHGDIAQSFHAHPLGIFALLVLLYRIFTILKTRFTNLTLSK